MKCWIFLASALLIGTSLFSKEASLDLRIPVVDMRDYEDADRRQTFLNTLYEAMTTVGFFAVRNTGVDAETIRHAYAQAEIFFKQSSDRKSLSFVEPLNGQRGFVPGEVAKGNAHKDKKEFYHIAKEGSLLPNVWPEQEGFKEAMTLLYDELERYVIPLQQAIITMINQRSSSQLDLNLLNDMTEHGESLLRALYYPALTGVDLERKSTPLYWAAPHTDIDLLAILPYATEKGLQVEVNGEWLNVVVPEDAFIVNVGDMLQNLSNGLFVSARHRVVAQEVDKDRFSMVLFVHPFETAPLDPLAACIELTGGKQLYAPGTRQEFLWERLLELGIAPALLEPYSKTGHVERQMQYHRASPQVVDLLIQQGLASPELLEELARKKNCWSDTIHHK
ncbi:MAG: 2-oxoglutarate and iron-dependent oxygenase domain-containing protein [Chlamydiales bacterium]|nr:2-oxoglutarate and iron-dependent oxygenase domain-containing protein [Chlamydiales bacterium]